MKTFLLTNRRDINAETLLKLHERDDTIPTDLPSFRRSIFVRRYTPRPNTIAWAIARAHYLRLHPDWT